MKRCILLLLFCATCLPALAQGTAFTYQGRLHEGTGPATGTYDLRFEIYDTAENGAPQGAAITNAALAVSNGLFTVTLDFGANVFTGAPRWLEISVRTNGAQAFMALSPRQPLTPSPYAIFAAGVNAGGINGGIPASQLVGVLPEAQLPTNLARLNPVNTAQQATGVPIVTSGFITGANITFGGSGYTNAPAVTIQAANGSDAVITATISNGVVVALTVQNAGAGYSSDATLTIAPPPSNAFQTFGGENYFSGTNIFTGSATLTNASNSFAGQFAGNGGGLTNLNAVALGGIGPSGFWKLNGNSVAPGQFLGSTNDHPLELRANGYRVLRIEPDPGGAFAGNIVGGFISNRIEQPWSGGNVIVGGGYYAGINLIRTNSRGNFIGAGSAHQIGPNINDAVIGGGYGNNVQSFNSLIGSGHFNTILPNSPDSGIVGGTGNIINSAHAAIAGGSNNVISGASGFIGGGTQNRIESLSDHSSIGGGQENVAAGTYSTVAGGYVNKSVAAFATVGGGYGNSSSNLWDTIGGGFLNVARGGESFIGGGRFNTTAAEFATIGGGSDNTSSGFAATVAGGGGNLSAGQQATVGGGVLNSNLARFGTISGGSRNLLSANAEDATVGGGFSNAVLGSHSVIGGGSRNTIHTNAWLSVIGGGAQNALQPFAQYCVIGGGDINVIESNVMSSVIGGGMANTIQTRAWYSTIGGGFNNYIWSNTTFATVAGGYINFIQTNADCAAIGGGQYNTVAPRATHATIPGGFQNTASAPFTFVAGNHAVANHSGAFVWADSSSSNNFSSTAANQFLIRASGGVGVNTPSPQTALHVRGFNSQLRLEDSNFNNYWNIYTETLGNPDASGNLLFVAGPSGTYGYIRRTDGSYFAGSDARLKREVQAMTNLLGRVLQLRPVSYRFKTAPASAPRALGLIAQEVEPLFPEVVDEHAGLKSVAYSALVPVALGAIQELNHKLDERSQEIAALKRQNATLEARLQRLERLLQMDTAVK